MPIISVRDIENNRKEKRKKNPQLNKQAKTEKSKGGQEL